MFSTSSCNQASSRVTFPIKPKLLCSSSPLPILSKRPQQCWRRHYNTWAGQCQLPQQFAKGPLATVLILGAEPLSASALTTLLKKIHANNPWQKEDTIRSVAGWPQSSLAWAVFSENLTQFSGFPSSLAKGLGFKDRFN